MKSQEFDDIYFSVEDGLAETRHTFLDGNNLPAAWRGRARFCICETGFGTGLNMLAAWRLFEETSTPGQRLDLVSIEKYPLSAAEIRAALAPWDLQPQLDRLLDVYPLRVRGFHRLLLSPRVTLTLIFDDVLYALPQLDARVDAWFLDGFAPAKNPDMWSSVLYENMARLSVAGASVATFTAAGDVRRGLQAAGFSVEKRKGYGRKRDMVVGAFSASGREPSGRPAHRAVVVGAGLAGLSAAWHLKREGVEVVVHDAGDIACGGSGNSLGLVNPKLTAQPSAQSDYYTSAYVYARHVLRDLGLYRQTGSLHLQTDDDKARRFAGYTQNLGWHVDHARIVDAPLASQIAGVRVDTPCLYYPDAGSTGPRDVCAALARTLDVRTHSTITDLSDYQTVVLANAAGVRAFCDLPVSSVRGQVTRLAPDPVSAGLRTNLCYGGYIAPVHEGAHMCGATFQPWDEDAGVRDADHARNIAGLQAAVPSLALRNVQGGWTGFRAASKDRFPIVGGYGPVYLSVAHGSHGLISGLMAGALLAAGIAGGPCPLGAGAVAALDASRFSG